MYYISRHTVELTGQKLTIRRQESLVKWGPNFSRGNEDVSSGALTDFDRFRNSARTVYMSGYDNQELSWSNNNKAKQVQST